MRFHFVSAASLAFTFAFLACSSSQTTGGSSGSSVRGPTNLNASPMGSGIHLTWTDNSANEAEFQIERKEGSGAFTRIASITFDTIQFHDTGVRAGASYTYHVRAVTGQGDASSWSNDATLVAPTGDGPGGTMDGGGGGTWDGGRDPTFAGDIVPLFQRSCGAANSSCHVKEAYGAASAQDCRGWLTLENKSLGAVYYSGPNAGQSTGCPDRSLYDRLTQLDAWQEPNGQRRKYVKAGDPQNSYLYNKIAGGPYGEDRPGVLSTPMPQNSTLPASDVAMVKKWIELGAPNN